MNDWMFEHKYFSTDVDKRLNPSSYWENVKFRFKMLLKAIKILVFDFSIVFLSLIVIIILLPFLTLKKDWFNFVINLSRIPGTNTND